MNDRDARRFSAEVRSQMSALAALAADSGESLSDAVSAVASQVIDVLASGGKLMFCGNGGSAADAQHVAAEYVVRFARARRPLPALALTTDTSVLTAAGNDLGYDAVFERQVQALGRAGDLLFLHSTSGESENLLRAAGAAREMGVRTVALLAGGGGRLCGSVDRALVVPTDVTARAQEIHLAFQHIVCDLVERAITEET